MIFLSHAATFNLKMAWHHLLARGHDEDRYKLINHLEKRYEGKVVLYYNCRTGISEAVRTLVPAGSAVAVNGLTCIAVPQAIEAAGCAVKYLDVDQATLNFDAKKLDQAARTNPKLKAVIIQNMLGITVDIAPIEAVAKKHRLVIIEDLAHCAGAHYPDGRPTGTVGDATVLSFGKGKVIDTSHGGALVLRSTDKTIGALAEPTKRPTAADNFRDRIYPIINIPIRKFWRIKVGPAAVAAALKLKLITKSADGDILPDTTINNWQARLALEQISTLEERATFRRGYADATLDELGDVTTPSEVLRAGSVPIRLPLLVHERTYLIKQLKKLGYYLDDIWYDVPVSPKRHYAKTKFPEEECPEATRIATQLINLPTDIPLEALAGSVHIIRRWQQERGRV